MTTIEIRRYAVINVLKIKVKYTRRTVGRIEATARDTTPPDVCFVPTDRVITVITLGVNPDKEERRRRRGRHRPQTIATILASSALKDGVWAIGSWGPDDSPVAHAMASPDDGTVVIWYGGLPGVDPRGSLSQMREEFLRVVWEASPEALVARDAELEGRTAGAAAIRTEAAS